MQTSASPRGSTPPRIALKVDVATLRGTEQGVPRLIETLRRYKAGATFLFNLGPDHTGRAIRRLLQPGFLRKVWRSSVVSHYGLRTLMYGTLLPGPDIGERCADTMRTVRDAGFETGIHAWDHVRWQDGVGTADADWTLREMRRAVERYEAIFGVAPRVHGAAGWQMNAHSYRLSQRLGFDFCSDTRGTCPYIPVMDAEIVACPQIPTTLPTFAELLGVGGTDSGTVAARMLRVAADTPAPAGHVFTVRAELEGLKLLPAFEQLLAAWREAGVQMYALGAYLEAASAASLPRHRTADSAIAGCSRSVAVQGAEFLACTHDGCV
jgi:undecaprenyl phosphate-alpha-L-ara4FN deformylase